MNDDAVIDAPPPVVPIRRKRGPNKPKLKLVPPAKPDEFAGMTENSCCDACRPDWCVISGTFRPAHVVPAHKNHFGQLMPEERVPDSTICGRPNITPVNVFVANPKVVDRYMRAKKILEHLVVDARSKR